MKANPLPSLLLAASLHPLGATVVTTAADENNGSLDPGLGSGTSLREAIAHSPAGSTITFAPALDGGIVLLGLGQLVINKNLSLDASGLPTGITVSGGNAFRVFDVRATVTMSKLTAVSGRANDGGGLRNGGSLTLTDCGFSQNTSTDDGGGILNFGTLAMTRCVVSNNSASDSGGGLGNSGDLSMVDSTVASNQAGDGGGGLFNDGGMLSALACVLNGNHAAGPGGGGGLDNQAGGTASLVNSTLTANTAATNGGGIDDSGDLLQVESCTLSTNQAAQAGGGIRAAASLSLTNSIVADNSAASGPDIRGSISADDGVNLVASSAGIDGGFAGIVAPPQLGSLGDHGGPTFSMPPLAASPAIDAGGTTTLATDQRGFARVVGGAIDIGAVEIQTPPAQVTTQADSGPGSLRDTIASAAAGTTISFSETLDGGTITLTSAPLAIEKPLVLDASNLASGLTLSAGDAFRVLEVGPGHAVTLRAITLSHGSDDSGGGILNQGSLTLDACRVTDNAAVDSGGGISNSGSLVLHDSDISGNSAYQGGGIHNFGTIDGENSRIFDNSAELWGGGIENTEGTVTLNVCHIFDNAAADIGGGLDNDEGTYTLTTCTFTGNAAGNSGGGLLNDRGTVALSGCTLAANTATDSGGGIANGGPSSVLGLVSCTLSGNSAGELGAAIDNYGSLTVDACTISGNDLGSPLGALRNALAGTLVLKNSIVAGNSNSDPGAGDPNLDGTVTTALGVNLTSGDPRLSPLGNHGGPTPTRLPLAGSPAIDAGTANLLATDQRGLPRVLGGAVDIGAVESGNAIPTVVVDTLADEDDGIASGGISLRDALGGAAAGSVISFAAKLNGGTIRLGAGELVADRNLDIDASALPAGIIVSAGGASRVMRVLAGRSAALRRLVIRDGEGFDEDGAGIFNEGYLELESCTMTGHNTEFGNGGGLCNRRGLVADDCDFSGNFAYFGGGIHSAGVATISACRFSENDAWDSGGGLYNRADMEVRNCTFTGNTAEAGGGLATFGTGSETEVTGCTFQNNFVSLVGGGIDNYGGGLSTVVNCTLSDNHAGIEGGGIGNENGDLIVRSCTIAGNRTDIGGGIYNDGFLSLHNTIVASNSATDFGPDLYGTLDAQSGVNLVTSTAGIIGGFSGIVAPPQLGPLAKNGGPTLTMPPQPGSPAIDAGSANSLATDQRGFPRVAGGAVDIGAVETGSMVPDLLLVVDTLADEDDGVATGGVSLRDAIAAAAPGAFVTFAPALDHGVITLSGPELVIAKDLDLDASALPSGIALTRGTAGRIFRVDAGSRVALAGLTLRDSENDDGPGGAIRNAGALSLAACKILGCVNIDDEGGGIYNDGSLSLTNCVIAGNLSLRGGGICNDGLLDLAACKIQGNIGDDGAGGFCNRRNLSLEDCSISDNFSQGGGGIGNYGGSATLGMNACTLDGNYGQVLGGGLENINATAVVTNCTFHDNSSDAGGGIGNQGGTLTVAACTVAGNRAEYSAGGIVNALAPSQFTLRNTIVASNTAGDEATDIGGRIDTQAGVNLVTTTNGIAGSFGGIVANPLLSPLANHGGPTRTMLPLAGSPAINAGASNTLPMDQRGLRREVGSAVDIGAVETGNAIPALVVDTVADQDEGDPSDGLSLREAIDRAGEGARITFAPALDGLTSALIHGQLTIGKDLAVDASSLPGGITVSGGDLSRVFRIEATSSVTLAALTLSDGNAVDGGGILNEGSLALDGCTLAENQATRGGGLFTATGATTALTESAVTGNWAGDSAGGIRNQGGTTATACRIEGNAAPSSGGIGNTGTMTLEACSITDNFATSGSAGGILNLGTMTLVASTLSENTAVSLGGGISNNGGSLALTTCTVAANLAMFDRGGGIATSGGTTLSASTVVGNTSRFWGGGIHVAEGAPLVLKNSIVADNGTMMGSPDIHGAIASQAGVNLVSSSDGIVGSFSGLVADPLLAPLGHYGGSTATLPPLPGSPVIEAAILLPGDPATDQSGGPRPRGPLPDIGAMEAVAFSTLPLADTDSDGIPDLVEGAYPQLSVGVDDSALDSDGDGVTDAEELAGMTDPGDGTDFPRVTAFAKAPGFDPAANPVFTLSFTTFPGLDYALEADQDLDFSGADHRILLPTFTATDYLRTATVTLLPGRDFIRAVRED